MICSFIQNYLLSNFVSKASRGECRTPKAGLHTAEVAHEENATLLESLRGNNNCFRISIQHETELVTTYHIYPY